MLTGTSSRVSCVNGFKFTSFVCKLLMSGVSHETAVCPYRVDNLVAYPLKVTLVWTDYAGSPLAAKVCFIESIVPV